jgi:multidrug transporter EmrE-like cation transporter
MRRAILLGFLLLLTFDTLAQVGLKVAGERINAAGEAAWLLRVGREPLILAVLLCYLGAFLTYISVLKYAPVGPAYAAAHGHVVTTLMVSMLIFGERLTWLQMTGAVSIVAGVALLALTETGPAGNRAAPAAGSGDPLGP